ncbi:MAG: hypothetical protein EBU90_04785 [Proteobacteria bacterium]|nr:hypothetical protein [Pseudomonadota bacterium]NBP13766.1 hypothetical protein [bacterium]
MNKIVQIKIFNDILDQFFDFLEKQFQYFKSDIILTRSTTEFIRNSNPRLVVEQFMEMVMPYRKQIFDCNEDFFLNFETNISSQQLTHENLLAGMKIKNMWLSPETGTHQKAYIWMYFQKLIRAGEKVIQ